MDTTKKTKSLRDWLETLAIYDQRRSYGQDGRFGRLYAFENREIRLRKVGEEQPFEIMLRLKYNEDGSYYGKVSDAADGQILSTWMKDPFFYGEWIYASGYKCYEAGYIDCTMCTEDFFYSMIKVVEGLDKSKKTPAHVISPYTIVNGNECASKSLVISCKNGPSIRIMKCNELYEQNCTRLKYGLPVYKFSKDAKINWYYYAIMDTAAGTNSSRMAKAEETLDTIIKDMKLTSNRCVVEDFNSFYV